MGLVAGGLVIQITLLFVTASVLKKHITNSMFSKNSLNVDGS